MFGYSFLVTIKLLQMKLVPVTFMTQSLFCLERKCQYCGHSLALQIPIQLSCGKYVKVLIHHLTASSHWLSLYSVVMGSACLSPVTDSELPVSHSWFWCSRTLCLLGICSLGSTSLQHFDCFTSNESDFPTAATWKEEMKESLVLPPPHYATHKHFIITNTDWWYSEREGEKWLA